MSGHPDLETSSLISIGAQLRDLVRRCGVPDSECADCVQETLLALLKTHRDWTLDEPRTLEWLKAVAHNQALMCHRRLRSHRNQSIDDLDSIPFRDLFLQADRENGQDSGDKRWCPRFKPV